MTTGHKIHIRTGRASLKERNEPYWRNISKGLAVGYFRGSKGGTWIARHFSVETGRRKAALGLADDLVDADGIRVLSYDQAQAAAQAWYQRLLQEDTGETVTGSHNIAELMAYYLADRQKKKRKKPKDMSRTHYAMNAHILPSLGEIHLSKLNEAKIEAWRDALAEARPRVRNKPNATEQAYREIDIEDHDELRKRQASAARIWSVLRAALNFGFKKKWIVSKAAWERIEPFKEIDAPKVRYLTIDECKHLIDACPSDFRALVRGALYTGCRYGELTAMRVDAFNPDANTIHVERSKSGRGRYIPVTEEGAAFFHSITSERKDSAPMFYHADGKREDQPWEHSQQRYWMERACSTAKIAPSIGFHILRHTYASQLAMNATPMPVIASLLGHADTRMTERHYAHLAPSHVADTLRANLPSFGFKAHKGPKLVNKSA